MYTVDYFISKFEAIPENKWASGFFELNGTHCANGHCGATESDPWTDETKALVDILSPLKLTIWMHYGGDKVYELTANINDGNTAQYQQPTPKQRILAALYDIKKLQSPEVKEKIVYVAVLVTITEQAKELVMS